MVLCITEGRSSKENRLSSRRKYSIGQNQRYVGAVVIAMSCSSLPSAHSSPVSLSSFLPPSHRPKGKVICTVPLDPAQQFIFAAHPHGIGTWNHFLTMTDGCRFLSSSYPRPRLDLGATVLFFIPFLKEILLWLGCVDAGASTAHAILARGYSSLIYIGGEKEQILTQRGKDIVVVRPRKGFCKLALQHDCPIVPVYAFGENDLYRTFNHLKDFQLWVASTFKLAFPPCWGVPFLPFLPLPVPVTVVMGEPLRPRTGEGKEGRAGGEKGVKPTREEVDELHTRYVEALQRLFDAHKGRHGGRSEEATLVVR